MAFTILNIASRSLAAEQLAMEVTGNNMANATTPGYRRETANLVESPPIPDPSLGDTLQGQGVRVDAITRAQNAFLSRSVRLQYGTAGYWNSLNTVLSQIQNVFQEPSSSGLAEAMNQFFNSWLTLSQTPDSLPARQAVLEQGKSLTGVFHMMSQQLSQAMGNINTSLINSVNKMNTLSAQIAQLNGQIAGVSSSGGTANTLLDQRGLLMDQLSQLANISYTVNSDQTVNIYLGSNPLVVNQQASSLHVEPGSAPTSGSSNIPPIDQIDFSSSPAQTATRLRGLANGSLKGLLVAGSDLSQYLTNLNQLAQTMISRVNALQTQGYQLGSASSGNNFFSGTSASSIAVSLNTPQAIAAASGPQQTGNGEIALQIAQLVHSPIPFAASSSANSQAYTFNQYYTNLVGQVGNDGQQAQSRYNSANATLQSLRNARQSATGVDINQSSAHLIQEQQSYQAAASLISVEQTLMANLLQAVG